jgi:hypothetical protein
VGTNTFVEVIGAVVDDQTVAFLSCIDMGCNISEHFHCHNVEQY